MKPHTASFKVAHIEMCVCIQIYAWILWFYQNKLHAMNNVFERWSRTLIVAVGKFYFFGSILCMQVLCKIEKGFLLCALPHHSIRMDCATAIEAKNSMNFGSGQNIALMLNQFFSSYSGFGLVSLTCVILYLISSLSFLETEKYDINTMNSLLYLAS